MEERGRDPTTLTEKFISISAIEIDEGQKQIDRLPSKVVYTCVSEAPAFGLMPIQPIM